jgi:1,4-alpha-glucan branching enzyme
MEIGSIYRGGEKCRFTVWAPFSKDVALVHFPVGLLLGRREE